MAVNSYQMWLSQVTQPYTYGNEVAVEVDYTLRTFHGLRPQSSIYTLSDGSKSQLLNLVGTIPVVSQQNHGRVIEVPLEICLPLHYPAEMPIIWIRPDKLNSSNSNKGGNLVIRVTDNVDESGMVWGMKQARLVEVVGQLQKMFAVQLPIVSAEFAHLSVGGSSVGNSGGYNGGYTTNSNGYSTSTYTTGSNGYNTSTYSTAYNTSTTSNTSSNIAPTTHTFQSSSSSNTARDALKRKVVSLIEEQLRTFDDEMDAILKTNATLTEGQNLLNREKLMLSNEINLLLKEINAVEAKRTEMESLCLSDGTEMCNRNATVPVDPASSQLLELLANESALMDVLYSLIKVTVTPPRNSKDNQLPLSTALRCIREISRKHFLTKAHIRKLSK